MTEARLARRAPAEGEGGSPSPRQLRRVVIVGAGFAGLECARALARAPVEVTILDRTNHHLFQPFLY
jgi:NADH dehydrogenase